MEKLEQQTFSTNSGEETSSFPFNSSRPFRDWPVTLEGGVWYRVERRSQVPCDAKSRLRVYFFPALLALG